MARKILQRKPAEIQARMTKLISLKANLSVTSDESMAISLINENLNIEHDEVLSKLVTQATYISSFRQGQLIGIIDRQIEECEEDYHKASIRANNDEPVVATKVAELEALLASLGSTKPGDFRKGPPALCFADRAIKDTLFKLDVSSGTLVRI